MGDVVNWPYPSRVDLPAADVLAAAAKEDFEGVIVLGFLKNGETYMASSYADGGTGMWLMERAKRAMHEWADEAERSGA